MEGGALRPAGLYRAVAGEGPIWHMGAIWYVDIRAPAVIRYDPETDEDVVFDAPETVAALAPLAGGILVAGRTALWALRDGAFQVHTPTPFIPGTHRFNDGCTDPRGRFLAGTTAMEGGAADGELWSFDEAGSRLLMSGFRTINGLAVSPDGRSLTVSDSHPDVATVWRCAYDAATGVAGRPEVFARLPKGRPDGACFDAKGGYWIAATSAGMLLRYDATGAVTGSVACGTPRVSKPCLCGADGRDLYVTTISLGHEDDPRAGRLLRGRLP
ncbi:MAG: SMP-30/gluconolactonase/LRE family protein [Pseudomonadota bacterium]